MSKGSGAVFDLSDLVEDHYSEVVEIVVDGAFVLVIFWIGYKFYIGLENVWRTWKS